MRIRLTLRAGMPLTPNLVDRAWQTGFPWGIANQSPWDSCWWEYRWCWKYSIVLSEAVAMRCALHYIAKSAWQTASPMRDCQPVTVRLLLMRLLRLKCEMQYTLWSSVQCRSTMQQNTQWGAVRCGAEQSVTNIFEYLNIWIFWIRIFIRILVRVTFWDMNIFGYSFVARFWYEYIRIFVRTHFQIPTMFFV